jgi:recombination protein RecT
LNAAYPIESVREKPLVFIRASSLAELFDCAHRWEGKHLLGMTGPTGGAAQLGTAVHAGTAAFDASRLPGGSPVSVDDAAGAVVDAIQHPEKDVDWGDTTKRDAERIALSLHTRYCTEVAPKQTYLGVEIKCERLELPELGIALTGTNDRIHSEAKGRGVTDLKTGKRAVGTERQGRDGEARDAAGRVRAAGRARDGHPHPRARADRRHEHRHHAGQPAHRHRRGEQRARRCCGPDGEPGFLEQASQIVNRSGSSRPTRRASFARPSTARVTTPAVTAPADLLHQRRNTPHGNRPTRRAAHAQTAVAARPLADMKPKEQIAYLLNQKKGELAKMLPKTLSIERLLKVAQIAATTTPALAKCDVASLVGAIGQCAQMGLEPNTVLGHAYLVPFNTKRKDADGQERWVNSVQVIIGYKGLIDLARRSGQIVSIAAHEVCENDHFELVYGIEEKLNHTPAMGARGDVVGFYAVAKLKDGGYSFEFMSVHQVAEIMENTQSKGKYGPWKEHFVEMGRKTVIRRLAKYLPLSIEFQTAVARSTTQATAGKDQNLDTIDGDFMLVPDDAPGSESVDAETGEIQQQAKPAAAQAQQQQAKAVEHQPAQAADWQPSEEELAEIHQREMAEAQAADPKASAAKAPAARGSRMKQSID